jgi:hypothetical protein
LAIVYNHLIGVSLLSFKRSFVSNNAKAVLKEMAFLLKDAAKKKILDLSYSQSTF